MTALQDETAKISLRAAEDARYACNEAKRIYADCYLRYIRDALAASWSWRRIGEGLGVSEQAVRRYWTANRQRAGRLNELAP